MSRRLDLYWSFRSPYSYLATPRLVQMADELDLDIEVKVVLPLAVRSPRFFEEVNPLWPAYLMRDVKRLAQYHGIPYRWPRPDPVVQDIRAGVIPEEQPIIWRLCRLGVEASRRGRGLAFIRHVSHTIWSGEVEGWDRGDHLADAASRAGLDLVDMEEAITGKESDHDRELERNQLDLEEAGHWGVPSMVYRGEVFFGQDRLDLLEWRIRTSLGAGD